MAPKHKWVALYLLLVFLTTGKAAAPMSVLRWTAVWLIRISSGGWITKKPPGNSRFRAVDRHSINVLHNSIRKNHISLEVGTQWNVTGFGRALPRCRNCLDLYLYNYVFSVVFSGFPFWSYNLRFTSQLIWLVNKSIVSDFNK